MSNGYKMEIFLGALCKEFSKRIVPLIHPGVEQVDLSPELMIRDVYLIVCFTLSRHKIYKMGMGQYFPKKPQVLFHVSTYQGSTLGTYS